MSIDWAVLFLMLGVYVGFGIGLIKYAKWYDKKHVKPYEITPAEIRAAKSRSCICKEPSTCSGDSSGGYISVCRTKAWNSNIDTIKSIQKHWNKLDGK